MPRCRCDGGEVELGYCGGGVVPMKRLGEAKLTKVQSLPSYCTEVEDTVQDNATRELAEDLGCTRLKHTRHNFSEVTREWEYEWLRRQIPPAQTSTVEHVRCMRTPVDNSNSVREAPPLVGAMLASRGTESCSLA